MKRTFLFPCLFSLLIVSYSYAEDKPFSGGVFLGGRTLNLDHQSGKFNEYNGMTPGLFGGGDVVYDTEKYHFTAEGAYLGPDDGYLKMKGGKWGVFKYSLFYNEFAHNLSFKDRSIYSAPGSETLSFRGNAPAIAQDSTRWPSTAFDYKVRRKDVGGSFDLTAVRPFFFNVEANQLKREGQIPWGAVDFFGGTAKSVELPLPVDNTTSNISALGGWKNKQFYVAFGGGFSRFNNDAEFTRFRDPFTTGGASSFGTIVGAPDNKSWNLKFTGTAKLPLSSTFALDMGYTKNTSQTNLLNRLESGTAAAPTVTVLGLNRYTFNGDVEYWNIGANLTSNPWKALTTKLYFKFLDKKNNSDSVAFINPGTLANVSNEIFSYQKTNIGAEASYRFLKNLKGILGYDFTDVKRRAKEAGEAAEQKIPDTWDHKFIAQANYNPFDWLGARIKYQRLYRGAHFTQDPVATPVFNDALNTVLNNNIRRFDIANKTQDMFKFTTDLSPLQNLDLALEYAYKFDNYDHNALGYQQSKRNEFILDGSYDVKGIKFFAFFDYDKSYTKQLSRYVNPVAGASADPNAAASPNSFNWDVKLENNNYAYGIGASIPIIKNKLAFTLQYDFEKNNGNADFTSQAFTAATPRGVNNSNIGIAPWDDYTRQSISGRLRYDINKDLGVVFGYLYSQFRVNDGQLNGYQYLAPGTAYLSGAYIDQSYKASVLYIRTMYRF
jgi:MtrB/PioB family decaheme-associated outer membrane protein